MKFSLMKLILTLFAIFFSVTFYAQRGDSLYFYKATYKLEYQEDSTDQNSVKSEKAVLYLGEGYSKFSSLGKAVKDSLEAHSDPSNKNMAEFMRIEKLTPETDFNYKIFKNYEEDKLLLVEKVYKDLLRYKQHLKIMDWQIQPENKEILGFSVQKATGAFAGRNYIAWFAPELPFSDGPYKFNGLPGLILEISDLKNHYHFKLIGFQELEKPVDKLLDLDNYKMVSQDELDQVRDDYNRDPFGAMERTGLKIMWEEGQEVAAKQEIRKKNKRQNNPIELQP